MAFSSVYVLGDSLVDAGNVLGLAEWYDGLPLSDLPEGAPTTELGYFDGRFSNGYTFADLLANKAVGSVSEPVFPFHFEDPWIGLPIAPFEGDPTGVAQNFAYGGSHIRQGDEVVPDLDGQTDALREAVDGQIPPDALIIVATGGNDVRDLALTGSDPVPQAEAHAELQRCANKLFTELSQLIGDGAQNIVVTGIADVGLIPRYDRDGDGVLNPTEQMRSAAATAYSIYLDTLIRTQVVPALQALGATITYVPLMDYVAADGTAVQGALNANLPTIAALNGLTTEELSSDLLQYKDLIFFDHVHPNAQANALLGAYMQSLIAGTPRVEQLPLTGANVAYRAAGTIGTAGEVDRLTFSLVAGTTYTLQMLGVGSLGTTGSLGDTSLRLLGPGGTVVATDDDSGVAFDATLSFTAATTGVYTLELSAVGSLTGNYLVQGAVDGGVAWAAGNTYVVSNASTIIIESAGAVGIDTVRSSVSYSLQTGSEIEALRTTDDRGRTSINLTGNDYAQIIAGNRAANTLDGRGGNDTLTGYDGNDVLIGGGGNDTFQDTRAGLNGDTITDFEAGDRIVFTDATLAGFTFNLTGSTLTYSGGSLILSGVTGTITTSAAAGGGVQLTLLASAAGDVRNDFNGDGRSDVLWRHDNGSFTTWLAQSNGGFASNDANSLTVLPAEWRVVGTGDFNGDGRDDVVWRRTDGAFTQWLAQGNGSFASNDANAWTVLPNSWQVDGVGDFNNDGRDDLVWRRSDGAFTTWLGQPNGGFVSNDANSFTVPTSWQVAATGDFNGDGRDDIAWRRSDGAFTNWLAQGNGSFTSNDGNSWAVLPTSWRIEGTGDFNGDGRDDLVWRNDNGSFTTWLAQPNGGFVSNDANSWAILPNSWQVVETGDYNGDGRDDILWRNSNGAFTNWLAQGNGSFISNDANAFTSLTTAWHVQGPDTFWA